MDEIGRKANIFAPIGAYIGLESSINEQTPEFKESDLECYTRYKQSHIYAV